MRGFTKSKKKHMLKISAVYLIGKAEIPIHYKTLAPVEQALLCYTSAYVIYEWYLIIQHLFVMACRNFSVRSAQFCGLTLTTKWVTFLSIAFFSLKPNFLMKFLYISRSLGVFRPEQTSTISSLSFDGICNNDDVAVSTL